MIAARPCAPPSRKKHSGGTAFFKKMLSGAGSSPLVAKGQIELMKNPLDALKTAEQILNSDPNSAAGHKLLADAAMAAELPKTAVLSLKIVVKNSPKDEEVAKEPRPRLFRLRPGRKGGNDHVRVDAAASQRPEPG